MKNVCNLYISKQIDVLKFTNLYIVVIDKNEFQVCFQA